MFQRIVLLVSVIVPSLVGHSAMGQDSNWNTILYGDRSTLLGGAVIASVDDASAAFYNPGAIADVAPADFFLATKVFDLTQFSLSLEGTAVEIDTDDLGKSPSFVGGMIPVNTGRHRFAYSIFKRHSFSLRLSETVVNESRPRTTDIVSERVALLFDASLSEDWVGLSWAFPVLEKTRVGLTMFGSYRGHRWYTTRSVESLRDDASVGTALLSREYSYGYTSLLWKLGVKHQHGDHLALGLSVTTPNFGLGLFSDGDTGASITSANLRTAQGEPIDDSFVAAYQSGLSATYRSPWTIGTGVSYSWPKRTVHVSLEFVDGEEQYNVIDPEPFEGQSIGDSLDIDVEGRSRPILNASIGLEEHLGDALQAFFGFHTDFSVADPDIAYDVYVTKWNLFHLSGGAQVQFGRAQITLGMGYAFGSSLASRFQALGELVGEQHPIVVQPETRVGFRRFKLIVGFGLRS